MQGPTVTNYKLANIVLDRLENCKDLGFFLQKSCQPSLHCQNIANKVRSRACLIRRCFVTKDHEFFKKMFVTYVRPILEYGTVIWSPWLIKDMEVLESVQRAYTKRFPGLWDIQYSDRLKTRNLEPLEQRRIRFDLIEAFKILNGL